MVAAIVGALALALLTPAAAQTYNASTRIGTAALVAPGPVDTFYGANTTHTNNLGLATRPEEIRELARALRNDVDLIYDYVRNNIEIEWAYGLRKGALGAHLDRSGTAFDQAVLMVDLLREAGLSASFRAGTITLTGAQFLAWSGVQRASAACQLLSSGGISASINGSTSANCSYGSSNVSTITLSHAWVAVVIGATTYLFDPSYKEHAFLAGFNLNTATGLSSGQALSSATSGMSTGNTSGVTFVRNLNSESLATTLQTYGVNLLTYINANAAAGSVDHVVGGQRIVRYDAPVGGLRQTSLPYTSVVQRSWSGDIPDQYRTTLTVQISKVMQDTTQPTIINRLLYVDEIYGRKLVVETNFATTAGGGGVGPINITLRVADETGLGPVVGQYNGNEPVLLRDGNVTLIANHPFAAAADGTSTLNGAYMDATVVKPVFMILGFTILHAWGDANVGLSEAWGQRNDTVIPPTIPPACETCPDDYRQSAGDARREQLAASWIVQASRAARLHAAIGDGVYNHHRSLGVVIGDAQPRQTYYGDAGVPPQSRTYHYNILDNFDRIDVDDAFSYVRLNSNAADRRAAIFAIAATRDALEASVAGQLADLPDTTSTATRFEWGNRPPAAEDQNAAYGVRRFYRFTTANAALAATIVVAEGRTTTATPDTHACGGEPPIGVNETALRRGRLAAAISQYATAGFDVISSEEAFLGPGQRGGAFFATTSPAVCDHYDSMQRGGAFVAVRSVGGEPVEIAHVVVGPKFNAKGGGGGAQTTHQAQYEPSTGADVLRSRFVDRSTAVGVDLRNGGVTYASPAEISVGNGEFPYRLSANLIWRGGFMPSNAFGPETHTQPSAPWTSSWHNMLSMSASGLEAMGETDPRAAAGTIAAFLAQQDIYRASYSSQREAAALLVGAWQLKQISGNVVTVNVGADTRQFVRTVSGQYIAPGAAAYATLSQTGTRTAGIIQAAECVSPTINYVTTRGWNYDPVSFQVTSANGDVQNFAHWRTVIPNTSNVGCAAEPRGFRLTSWSFPQGVSVNLTYAQPDEFNSPVISEITNSLGRRIRYNYTGSAQGFRWAGFDNGLSGVDARATQIAATGGLETITSVTDAALAQTRFTRALVGVENVLTEVFDANDTTIPSLRYAYDAMARVKEARDGEALQGTRNPYLFRIAPLARGEREDPAGGRYAVMSNLYDSAAVHTQRYVDELGRTTTARLDGRGRLDRYTYPEGDSETLVFDARNRITSLTRAPKPGSGLSNLVISATWNDTWNRPATVTDARGYRTDFAYVASGQGAGQLQTVTRPAPSGAAPIGSGARPVYAFSYAAFGRVATTTDPTGLVIANAINATNGDIDSTTLDPGGAPHINATTSFAYDAIGDLATQTDPRGNATSTSYDAMRRPTLVRHHNGGAGATLLAGARTNYNLLGQVTSVEGGTAFSGGNVTAWLTRESRTYTPTGQVATVTNGANNTTTNAYDGLDRLLTVSDPVNRVTRNEYDLAGQLVRIIRADGSALQQDYARYTYSLNGQAMSVRDANDNRSAYVYDGHDRLCRLYFPVQTLGANAANTGGIAEGSLTCSSGGATPDYEGYGYDANGNRTSLRVRSGETIGYAFDNLNRESVKDIPGGTSADVSYAYDASGRRLSALFSESGQGVVYAYDTAGRLASETSYGRATTFAYDASSNRTSVLYTSGGAVTSTYDALNRVDVMGENGVYTGVSLLADFSYDALSRRTGINRGNGAATSYGYDDASRLTSLTHDLAASASDQAYGFGYTNASQINQRTASNDAYNW
ncbi:MAG: hypothetical protein ACT4OF_05760, partial [Caulobacteraceae bacterium]